MGRDPSRFSYLNLNCLTSIISHEFSAFWLSINTEKFHSIISNSLEDNLRDETLVFSRPFDGLEGDNVTFGFECSVAMQIAVRECFVLKVVQ